MEDLLKQNALGATVDMNLTGGESPFLTQSNALGQGFNVFGELNIDSRIRHLFSNENAPTKEITLGGKTFKIPAYMVPISSSAGDLKQDTCMSREALQESFSANANVSAKCGLFSGEMSLAYKSEYKSSVDYAYTYRHFNTGEISLQLGEAEEYRSASFVKAIEKLPPTVDDDNLDAFISFFKDFGIYYTDRIRLGGNLSFYVSIKKSSAMGKEQIDATAKAQYDGLFASGSIEASMASSKEWKSFSENSHTNVIVRGGDTSILADLASVNPLKPSTDTVGVYKKWIKSANENPAVVGIGLKGIWHLCGNKKDVVEMAWGKFKSVIHPKLTIETISKPFSSYPVPVAVPPIITFNGALIQPAKPHSPMGIQVVILSNNGKMPKVLHDKYYILKFTQSQGWKRYLNEMFHELVTDINGSKHNKKENIMVLTTYGLDVTMVPSNAFYTFLKANGAGKKLENWKETGSKGHPSEWVSHAFNYVLVSLLGDGPNTGLELLGSPKENRGPAQTDLEGFFFKDSVTGLYSSAGV